MEFEVRLEPNRPVRKVGRQRARPVPDVPIQQANRFVLNPQPVRNIWRHKEQWPFVPSGFLYVPDAFDQIGEMLYGDEWTGEEGKFRQNVGRFPKPSQVFQGDTDVVADLEKYREGRLAVGLLLGIDMSRHSSMLSNREWCEATDIWYHFDAGGPLLLRRRAAVIEFIHRHAEAGDLIFYIRREGEMLRVRRSAWNVEPPEVQGRIELGLLVPIRDEVRSLFPQDPLFVRQDELQNLLRASANPGAISAGVPSGDSQAFDRRAAIATLAAQLDSDGIRKGKVRADHVAERWPSEGGPPPGVKEVLPHMTGKSAGRPAGA